MAKNRTELNIESLTLSQLAQMFAYGRFATVKFITKKDGSIRTLNGKTNVISASKGGKPSYNAAERGQLRVADVNLRDENGKRYSGYRSVTVANVLEVSANKKLYKVINSQPESSFISGIKYENNNLIVTINNQRVYRYLSVPKDIAMKFYTAKSRGIYYNENIKGRYIYEVIH